MKLAIFDKDSTLTTPKSGAKFVQHPQDQVLLPKVAEGITAMAADGWTIGIASNQGGVSAGYKSLDEAIQEMWYCLNLLPRLGMRSPVEAMMFCPNDGESAYLLNHVTSGAIEITNNRRNFRKPGSGMIDCLASQIYGRLWFSSVPVTFIGDRPEDKQAAANARVRFMWADEWRAQF